MDSKYRMLALGALIGGAASVVLAVPSLVPHAIADEQTAVEFSAAPAADLFGGSKKLNLLKPNWAIEDGVSTEILSSTVIRKIEAGRTTFVTIARTSSGTYSSDALDSPNFRYPGVHQIGVANGSGMLAKLTGDGWKVLHDIDAGSFVNVVPFEGGQVVIEDGKACMFTKNAVFC